MEVLRWTVATLLMLASLLPVLAQTNVVCSTSVSFQNTVKTFSACATLVQPGSSIAWTYNNVTSILEVGFTGVPGQSSSWWVGWGVNPSLSRPGNFMVGSGVVIARWNSQGSLSYGIYDINDLSPDFPATSAGSTNVQFSNLSAAYDGTSVTIHAEIIWSRSSLFHLWNSGSLDANGNVLPHSLSQLNGKAQLDLSTGEATAIAPSNKKSLRYNHGIVNTLGWGILLPIGVMIARYVRPFKAADPAWFYAHITVQLLGFIFGVTGWGMGRKLGNSGAVDLSVHNGLATTVFIFVIVQALALVLRPTKESKLRFSWNIYHHSLGYSTVLLGIINVFVGFHILFQVLPDTKHAYRSAFIGFLVVLGVIALVLEGFTWVVYLRGGSRVPSMKLAGDGSRENGYSSGYADSRA